MAQGSLVESDHSPLYSANSAVLLAMSSPRSLAMKNRIMSMPAETPAGRELVREVLAHPGGRGWVGHRGPLTTHQIIGQIPIEEYCASFAGYVLEKCIIERD